MARAQRIFATLFFPCCLLFLAILTLVVIFVLTATLSNSKAQLTLEREIKLGKTNGSLGEFYFDLEGLRLFLTAPENETFTVINLDTYSQGRVFFKSGIEGFAYSGGVYKIFVSDSQGVVTIYDGRTFYISSYANFTKKAGNIQIDEGRNSALVARGTGDGASIGTIDLITLTKGADASFELGGEAVNIAVDMNHTYIYANVPYRTAVAKINSAVAGGDGSYELFRLPDGYSENYALTLLSSQDKLLVGTRSPAAILILNATNGEVLETIETVDNVKTIAYDEEIDRIYAVGSSKLATYYRDMYGILTKATDIDLKTGKIPLHKIIIVQDSATAIWVEQLKRLFVGVTGGEVKVFRRSKTE